MATQLLPAGRAVLFVAHPGHELCLHGFLERVHPTVFVLTDGSGAAGTSRVGATARVLAQCGAPPGSVFGRFGDADLYRAILERDVTGASRVLRELADALIARDDTYLVSDPLEFYNPNHDLCRVIADLARTLAAAETGRAIEGFDYLLTSQTHDGTPAVTIELDDDALARKLRAADAYVELRAEVDAAVVRYGRESFRREQLYAAGETGQLEAPGRTPFYETFGEGRVAAGSYPKVLRYERHFLPFVTALAAAAGVSDALVVNGARRFA